jgi:magnesium chelatase subunit I
MSKAPHIKTLGELKSTGYQPKSIKDELRNNLIQALKNKTHIFNGIVGYEHTVLPDLQRAILSRHNINLLGLRGQAKTRIARLMTHLLDEYIPVVQGSPLNDDPLQAISFEARTLIAEMGDKTPVEWMHRSERFVEKLATPDVTVADLIGDIDPIKAANLKISYADERAIHFGLVPRSNRCIFVINELPDLQARIQVALFNILQEGDIQIRGFKLRMPLDIQFVFTANPEDYTNRGSIVTPLKDRIQSQIITHYPQNIADSRKITEQEARLSAEQQKNIHIPDLLRDVIEQIAFEARNSEYVDAKSGVSARLTISAMEQLASAAERRMLLNNEAEANARITDLWSVTPALNGKIELVYEGEQEGPKKVAQFLISKALRTQFLQYFADPEKLKKKKENNPYEAITNWFAGGGEIELHTDDSIKEYIEKLRKVKGLEKFIQLRFKGLSEDDTLLMMEFLLFGLAEYSQLTRTFLEEGIVFKDLFSSMFSAPGEDDLNYN